MKPPDKPDELELMRRILANDGRLPPELWGELEHGRQFPRGHYVLEKWWNKNWWDYGVSLRSGWITDEGRTAFTKGLDPGKDT